MGVTEMTMQAGPVPADFRSKLATQDQDEIELLVTQILADPRVRSARDDTRKVLESNSLARLPDGKARLDIVLDGWVNFLVSLEANGDPDRPRIGWVCNTSLYTWCGRTMGIQGGSVCNPDNIYRLIPIDPAARYEVHGRLQPMHPAQFTFQLIRADNIIPVGNDNTSLGMVNSREMVIGPDGAFVITLDSDPAGGRPNHLQTPAGGLLRLLVRDTLSSWLQSPNAIVVKRVGGPAARPAPTVSILAERASGGIKAWVSGWLHYVEQWAGPPPENQMVEPHGRAGGWGYISPMRFRLADDEAMVLTIDDGGSEYSSIQLTDVWTIAPDPQKYVFSYTTRQAHVNADGTYTYVVAAKDPGAVNWVDTAGMHQGWVAIRWQGVPRTRLSSEGLLREVRVVKVPDLQSMLPAAARGVTAEQRKLKVQQRISEWRLRIARGNSA
jgi:hypothetical protein